MNGGTDKNPTGTSRTNYRFKVGLPPVKLTFNHLFSVFCPDNLPWQSFRWGRFGSGGIADARHCFVDDWRLEHLWRRFGQGLAKVLDAGIVTAPDFTIDEDFPLELVQYQIWRSRVLTTYWQEYGVSVVPVLQWGCLNSFPICARGIRPGSVVAVRGPQRGTECAWMDGARYMQEALQPSLVLHFGNKLELWDRALYLPLRTTR
ncbi:MAG: DUF4417 domain-containing protein [Desulfobulbus sp.]|nr:DUF4417 domain-containing protein [Desulfobulbus sp.]